MKMIVEPSLFWNMSLFELREYQEIYTFKEKQRIKEKLIDTQLLSNLIIDGVAYILGATKQRPKTVMELFPSVFEDEQKVKQENEMKVYISKFKDFALRHNHSRKEHANGNGA